MDTRQTSEYEIYKKPNFFAQALSGKPSLYEDKIIAIYLSQINKAKIDRDSGQLITRLPASQLRKLLNEKNDGSFYSTLEEAADRLLARHIGVSDPVHKKFDLISIFTRLTYEEGYLTCAWNPYIREYLIEKKASFTLLNLDFVLDLKSVWSLKLYELLKSMAFNRRGENLKHFEVEINVPELKFKLGVADAPKTMSRKFLKGKILSEEQYDAALEKAQAKGNDAYPRWVDFKDCVITPACKEISENKASGMTISYRAGKKGRAGKILSIIFDVDYTDKFAEEMEIVLPKEEAMILRLLSDLNDEFTKAEIALFVEDAKEDEEIIKKAYAAYRAAQKKGEVEDEVAYMRGCIKKMISSPKKKSKASSFDTMVHQDYDFGAIEEMLEKKV